MKNELLAPNGKPSNLTPEQYKLVRTPAFKSWFGSYTKEKLHSVLEQNFNEVCQKMKIEKL
jgi:hypothetical protein